MVVSWSNMSCDAVDIRVGPVWNDGGSNVSLIAAAIPLQVANETSSDRYFSDRTAMMTRLLSVHQLASVPTSLEKT